MDPGPGAEGDAGEGLRVLLDPELSFPEPEDRMELWEGCLSIPGLRGRTERKTVVDVRYRDRTGRECRERFEGFPAAVVQHEADHLDGVLFFRRMPDLAALAFEDQFARWHAAPEPEEEKA
jgi:peptide deformylase